MVEYFEDHAETRSAATYIDPAAAMPAIAAFEPPRPRAQRTEAVAQERKAEFERALRKLVARGGKMAFPANLTSVERRAVHELAEELGLCHASTGLGNARRITVEATKPESPRKVEAPKNVKVEKN